MTDLASTIRAQRERSPINWTGRKTTDREAAVADLLKALKPFATISLVRDQRPDLPDMIDGPDLSITPAQIRAARTALAAAEAAGIR